MSAIALLWLFVAVFLEVAAPVAYGSAQCPKVLYMDDVNITKMGFGPEDAKLWQEAGINGVFIEGLMPAWQIPLCTNYCADRIELIARFQKLFGEHGITDNFMYVTIPRPGEPPFHWESQNDRDQVVRNFRTGAASARKAGLKGIALDLESYTKGFWNRNDTIPNKPELIQSLGHA